MNLARVFSRLKHLELYSLRILDSLLSGSYRSVFRGPGLEFAEVRSYVDGDDQRGIDWNVSSRLGSLYTKTFREERELNVFLIVDLSASMRTGRGAHTLHETVDILCSVFAFAALQNNDRIGACYFSDAIDLWIQPAKGRTHALRLIQDLVDSQPKGRGSNLSLALRTTGEALKRRGICVVISDFKTTGYREQLAALAAKHDVIAIRLISAEDLDFPTVGTFYMQDPESNQVLPAFGTSGTYRRAYREFWTAERKAWIQECRRQRVAPLEINTGEDPLAKLYQFFERRRSHRGWR